MKTFPHDGNNREYDPDADSTIMNLLIDEMGNRSELNFTLYNLLLWMSIKNTEIPNFKNPEKAISMRLLRLCRKGYLKQKKIEEQDKAKLDYFDEKDKNIYCLNLNLKEKYEKAI